MTGSGSSARRSRAAEWTSGKPVAAARTKLTVLDLFSGIGGFSLGLERTGGFQTVAFCEIAEFPRQVLRKHWPDIPIYEDVTNLDASKLADSGIHSVDVITGGFPCQDLSIAGKRNGIGPGTRSGLWSEIVRLIRELRPRYVIVENVANLLAGPSEKRGGWFGRVLGDLAECGYDAEWENIPAAAVGAPHRRERVWIVAYPDEIGRTSILANCRPRVSNEPLWITGKSERERGNLVGWLGQVVSVVDRDGPKPVILGTVDGLQDDMDRIAACGNSVIPQIPEMIGRAILDSETARPFLPPDRECAELVCSEARSVCGRQLARVHRGAGRFS